jgi:plasmid stabilization system protein ParE
MTLHEIELHPAAVREAGKAFRWYFRRSAQAGFRFRGALEAAFEQIAQTPDRWPTYLHGTATGFCAGFPTS